jgi:hypothetical protein
MRRPFSRLDEEEKKEGSPENVTYISPRGVEVTVTRVSTPDAHSSVQQLQIQYGSHQRPGTVVWLPDVPRCWPKAEEIIGHYRHDRDNLGRPFGQRLPQGAVESGSEGDRAVGVVDVASRYVSHPDKENHPSSDYHPNLREEHFDRFDEALASGIVGICHIVRMTGDDYRLRSCS